MQFCRYTKKEKALWIFSFVIVTHTASTEIWRTGHIFEDLSRRFTKKQKAEKGNYPFSRSTSTVQLCAVTLSSRRETFSRSTGEIVFSESHNAAVSFLAAYAKRAFRKDAAMKARATHRCVHMHIHIHTCIIDWKINGASSVSATCFYRLKGCNLISALPIHNVRRAFNVARQTGHKK